MEALQLDISWPLLAGIIVGALVLMAVLSGIKGHELRKQQHAWEESRARMEELRHLHFLQPQPTRPAHRHIKSVV